MVLVSNKNALNDTTFQFFKPVHNNVIMNKDDNNECNNKQVYKG